MVGAALVMAGLRRYVAALATPKPTASQQSSLYDKLLSDSEQDIIMTHHTESMLARFAVQRAAAAEEEDGPRDDGALTSDLLGEKGAWEG